VSAEEANRRSLISTTGTPIFCAIQIRSAFLCASKDGENAEREAEAGDGDEVMTSGGLA